MLNVAYKTGQSPKDGPSTQKPPIAPTYKAEYALSTTPNNNTTEAGDVSKDGKRDQDGARNVNETERRPIITDIQFFQNRFSQHGITSKNDASNILKKVNLMKERSMTHRPLPRTALLHKK